MKDTDPPIPEKLFSLEEANQLIPLLRRLMRRVIKERAELASLQAEIQRARSHAPESGGSRFGLRYLVRLESFSHTVQKIETLGVLVKDYQTGLCDFPHLKDGRVVYLCWKLGEDKVGWWHDIEAGFAGRQLL